MELEDLYDYTDTLYAPIGITDTRVSSFTFQSGTLAMTVSNGDSYSFNLDNRYVKADNYVESASFNTTNGVLTLQNSADRPSGTGTERADVTVDLDGRYKLQTAQDVTIDSLEWNASSGNLYASRNDGTNTSNENLDGRYYRNVTFSGTTFTFTKTSSDKTTIQIPETRVDIPNSTKMLFYQTSAPTGWVKETNSTNFNNRALRVVTGSVSTGGTRGFSNVFSSTVSTGGSVTVGNLGITGSPTSNFGSGFAINRGNLHLDGNPNAGFSSGFTINKGNFYCSRKIIIC